MRAVYDLHVSPPTYDFIGFLLSAERHRTATGAAGIDVLIRPGPAKGFRADRLPPFSVAEREAMLKNVVFGLARLLPSVTVCEMLHGGAGAVDFPHGYTDVNRIRHYGTRHMVEAWRAGCFPLIPRKMTFGPQLRFRQYVTVTLRTSAYWPARNSHAGLWARFIDRLRRRGFTVEVITCSDVPDAAERAALYAGARRNYFVNNGPAWMATAMQGVPVTIYNRLMPRSAAPCVSGEYWAAQGFPLGSQVGRPGHKIRWRHG